MDIDLKDLQIDHPRESPKAPKGWWRLLFFLLLIGASVLFWWREQGRAATAPLPVTTETVRSTAAAKRGRAAFSAAGWVKLPNYHPTLVTPLTAGRLDKILVVEGDRVQAGQEIARLYDKDHLARRESARAALAVAEAEMARLTAGFRKQEVDQALAEVTRLEAERDKTAKILARSRELQPGGAISLEELQVDQAAWESAKAALAKARQNLALHQEGYRKEEIALARATLTRRKAELELASLQVEYTRIKAPVAGMVLERMGRVGQWVTPAGGTIASLYDPADMEARIDVNQDDVSKVRLGQIVDLATRAETGKVFRGKVVLIEPKADQVKNIVRVKVKFLAPEKGVLFPDMVVTARFRAPEKDKKKKTATPSGPTVTAAAVVARENKKYVFVINAGRAHLREVALGAIDAGRYRVTKGLETGERVAVAGVEYLTDGCLVRDVQSRGE